MRQNDLTAAQASKIATKFLGRLITLTESELATFRKTTAEVVTRAGRQIFGKTGLALTTGESTDLSRLQNAGLVSRRERVTREHGREWALAPGGEGCDLLARLAEQSTLRCNSRP
jgi:hypothetical protein